MIKFKKRVQHNQDLEENINRVINFAYLSRVTIFFTLLVFYGLQKINFGELNLAQAPSYVFNWSNFFVYTWFVLYGLLLLVTLLYPSWQRQMPVNSQFPNASAVIDISMMAWLMGVFGGTSSGFGFLILPFLMISCLLSYGRHWVLYSSYATLLIILVIFVEINGLGASDKNREVMLAVLFRGLVLCGACYAVALVTSFSASYLLVADKSISQHKNAIERLNALNKVVLNQAQEAVLVVDGQCFVWLCNRRANHYFPDVRMSHQFDTISGLVRRWRGQPNRAFETNIMLQGEDMSVRAIPVIQEAVELLILFIRAERELLSEAQSVKLTSLGLLTANLAHEIRNPLSAMRQANDLLNESAAEGDPASPKLTAMIDNNIARIDKMIEEVSSLNKRDRINKENIQLRDFWLDFRQEFVLTRPQAANCIRANIDFRAEVVFDPMHLQQIMWNLCNNAWRHSSQQGNAAMSIIAQPINAYQVSLMVLDDGSGVSDDVLPHLFEPFYTSQAHAGGTGLGLYVARELAHANKGDLRYLADKKAFEIILPRANKL